VLPRRPRPQRPGLVGECGGVRELLRNGMTVDQISGGMSFADKRGLTIAAQHELCPDIPH
jgi:hypothetical protein